MKAAFLAFDQCALWQVGLLQLSLRECGWFIRTLSLGGQPVTTDGGVRLQADDAMDRAAPRDYQLLFIAGGQIDPIIAADSRIKRFLRQYDSTGQLIAAIGPSIQLLAVAGLLGGLRVAVESHIAEGYPAEFGHSILDDADTAKDGNIITAREGAFTEWTMDICEHLKCKPSKNLQDFALRFR
jgi:putative intracellular protease/amidase